MAPDNPSSGASLRWWGFGALAPLSLFIALGLVIVGGVAGFALAAAKEPTYYAYASTLLDQPLRVAESQDSGVVDKLSRLRLKYAGLARSDAVLTPAATAVGLKREDLDGKVLARVDPGSLLLVIGAVGSSEAKAVALANALAESLRAYIASEQQRAQIAKADTLSLSIVAAAHSATKALPTTRSELTSGVGTALVVFVLVAAALDVMRRRALKR